MKNWVKWAAVAGGALLLVKATKARADTTSAPPAPGVKNPADVSYRLYKKMWDEARAVGNPTFSATGNGWLEGSARYAHKYTWETPGGSLVNTQKVRIG